jgi:opacity protein-like surface antigen
VMAQPEIHFREYNGVNIVMGPPVRNDVIISVIAGVHYNFRNWLAATLDYHFTQDSTDYTYMVDGTTDDPSYTRHELLFGMRVAL